MSNSEFSRVARYCYLLAVYGGRSLQKIGGDFHNVVAASATIGLHGKEGALIRKTIIPTLYYLTAAGIIGCLVLLVF